MEPMGVWEELAFGVMVWMDGVEHPLWTPYCGTWYSLPALSWLSAWRAACSARAAAAAAGCTPALARLRVGVAARCGVMAPIDRRGGVTERGGVTACREMERLTECAPGYCQVDGVVMRVRGGDIDRGVTAPPVEWWKLVVVRMDVPATDAAWWGPATKLGRADKAPPNEWRVGEG